MIGHWALIEADFQREYRIDLPRELLAMTFRRFLVLLGGLSAESRFAMALANPQSEPLTGKAREAALKMF